MSSHHSQCIDGAVSDKANQASDGERNVSERGRENLAQASDSHSDAGRETAQSDEKGPVKGDQSLHSSISGSKPAETGTDDEDDEESDVEEESETDDIPGGRAPVKRPVVQSPKTKPANVKSKSRVEDEAECPDEEVLNDPSGIGANAQEDESRRPD